jgi:hypothetical protein
MCGKYFDLQGKSWGTGTPATPATKTSAPHDRYDRSRDSLARNAAYAVAAYLA